MPLSRSEQVKTVLLPGRGQPTQAHSVGGIGQLATPVHGVGAAAKVLSRPPWLLFHVVVLVLAALFVRLGFWQLSVSTSKHFDFFNFQYFLQWLLLAAFGLYVWVRVMRYRLNPPAPVQVSGGAPVLADVNRSVQGPALFAGPGASGGGEPAVYRGYVMAQSSRQPVRSHGDAYHDAYNDYLWQIGVADGDVPDLGARSLTHIDGPDDDDEPGSNVRQLS